MDIAALQSQFRGAILTPGMAEYDSARQIWNGMIDRRPAAIARCSGPADVQVAVRFARDQDIYPAIRSGGHNVAGLAMLDDGLVIDMTRMKGIFVDAAAGTATAQMGLTWGDFDRETHSYGLATTGGLISTTGMAGLTLGGGVGWLMGRCGLVCDNTLGYDVVLADGEVVRAASDLHPDLFWALKGGGGNFGVVTSITYRMYPIRMVISGMILYPLAMAREVLRFYRDFVTAGLPDELIVYAAALTSPDGHALIGIAPTWCGDNLDEGERRIAPLRKFGSPVADTVARMPYPVMQQMMDAAAPYGIRSYWKSRFLSELPDSGIDAFLQFGESKPSPRTIAILEHSHGAASRVAPEATAFPSRHAPFDLVIISMWDNAAEDALHRDWTRQFYSSMEPWSTGTVYVNSLDQDDAARLSEAYGVNQARLAQVKAMYDPENRFRHNQNIQPRAQAAGS